MTDLLARVREAGEKDVFAIIDQNAGVKQRDMQKK